MITTRRFIGMRKATQISVGPAEDSAVSDRAVRVIHVVLALYLLPALLVVLALGGLGMVVVGVGRVFAGPIQGSIG
jgi:hypothetical protein